MSLIFWFPSQQPPSPTDTNRNSSSSLILPTTILLVFYPTRKSASTCQKWSLSSSSSSLLSSIFTSESDATKFRRKSLLFSCCIDLALPTTCDPASQMLPPSGFPVPGMCASKRLSSSHKSQLRNAICDVMRYYFEILWYYERLRFVIILFIIIYIQSRRHSSSYTLKSQLKMLYVILIFIQECIQAVINPN